MLLLPAAAAFAVPFAIGLTVVVFDVVNDGGINSTSLSAIFD